MEAVSIPNITEFVKTETLPKGRVLTTVSWFLLDPDIITSIVTGYTRGEVTSVEVRVGTAVKCPTDVYNKPEALKVARGRLKKTREVIKMVFITGDSTKIYTENYVVEKFTNGKIIVRNSVHSY